MQLALPAIDPTTVEHLWWRLLEDTGDVFYVHDLAGRFLFVSPAFYRLTGYAEPDLAHLSARDLLTPEDYAANELRIMTAMGGGKVEFPFEMAIRRKDGSVGYAEFSAAVFASDDGVPRVVGVGRDVTARKQGESELREALAFQATLAEVSLALHAAPTLDALLPMICVHSRRLLGVDGARLFVVRDAELVDVARDGDLLFPEADAHCPLTQAGPLAEALRGGVTLVVNADGATDVMLLPLSGRRGPVGVLAVGKRQAPDGFGDRLRQRAEILAMQVAVAVENAHLLQDVRRADRLKTDFLSSVSHDLRTPLNVIVGYTDIHLEGLLGPINPEQDNALRRVRATALTLAGLINATLDLNRLEAGRLAVDSAPMNLSTLWNELLGQLEDHPDWGQVPLRWEADGVPVLLGDSEKLKLILRNLVGNALKFTRRGEIRVAARYDPLASRLELTVADTGPGIAPADLPHIFGMFRQGAAAQARGGVGLGLYLVKRVVELLGGEVTVRSEPDAGATFRVSVPAVAVR